MDFERPITLLVPFQTKAGAYFEAKTYQPGEIKDLEAFSSIPPKYIFQKEDSELVTQAEPVIVAGPKTELEIVGVEDAAEVSE